MIARRAASVAVMATLAAATTACHSRPAAGAAQPAADSVAAREAGRIAGERVLTAPGLPRTRAERSGYTETSRYADVVAFLDSLGAAGLVGARGEIGRTTEGRAIPYVVLSRPAVTTPAAARALGRPIVYVQANIHAGEVEGKEALLALVRDLAARTGPGVLDSIVLVAVPIYNADGNERFASQSVNRTEQNGPELVGQRPNAQGLDLNRDYVKAEAPETRASLAMFDAWDPDVFVDLHTTDGSYHGFALTYAGSLNPAAPLGPYTRDSLLPELRRRVRARHGFETFDYGNFDSVYEERDVTDTVKRGWYTYDHRPRFGTNYYGLRGRVAVLSEAYSHDPFERRVAATYAFVRELLSLVAERSGSVAALAAPRGVAIRGRLTTRPDTAAIPFELLARTGDSSLTQPGVPRGVRRTGRMVAQRMPVYARFEPALERPRPLAYLLPAGDTGVVRLLRLHGVRVTAARGSAGDGSRPPIVAGQVVLVESFALDSMIRSPRPFQGHNETRLVGRWTRRDAPLAPGDWLVRADQPHAALVAYLLEPESDDGLATWNLFDAESRVGGAFPVRRIVAVYGSGRAGAGPGPRR